jgi:magnesium transporter
MNPAPGKPAVEHLNEAVLLFARQDFAALRRDDTIEQALATIRSHGVGERVVYFYVVDEAGRLCGVLPTRRLLASPLDRKLAEVMVAKVIAIPCTATVMEACEYFALHKFFAFPLVDPDQRIVGVVDVGLFTDEVFDIAERAQMDDVFEAIGFRVSQVRDASPWRAFRFRFPWLVTTIVSGTFCAFLAGAYELTLAKSLVLAFFLTMILGLGESVSIQSMTMAIQALHATKPTLRWYWKAARREAVTALLLGATCGTAVALIVCIWRGPGPAAFVIGAAIFLTLGVSCLAGLTVPTALHALKLDPKIAAGPVTLALADIFTLVCYFNLAKYFL